jgi:hypothetical protein
LILFMGALYEAILLVVIVSLVGFWEWRSAVLLAISIPITLAMTFGFMWVLGIDIQQVSVATLIIALGLLVDDPVVAGDSIKRGLAEGQPNIVASWLGPTKLATAIMFATVTNIAAYIPFLMLTGTMGEFLYSLPIVYDVFAGGFAPGFNDVCAPARLLPAPAKQEGGEAHRSTPHHRIHGLVRTNRKDCDGTSLEGLCWFAGLPRAWCLLHVATEDLIYAGRRAVLVLH